jgi:D-alanyl-D-alanine carboxypeptidase
MLKVPILKSIIIASANDSAVALAENIGGSERAFVSMMNTRAKELGMYNTLYANATGLSTPEQYSTAYDTAILLKELDKYSIYHKYSAIWMDYITHSSGRKTELVNTNRLIKYYSYCKCGKTGFTDEAGYCLASIAEKSDMKLIAVTLNCNSSADRFKECMELFLPLAKKVKWSDDLLLNYSQDDPTKFFFNLKNGEIYTERLVTTETINFDFIKYIANDFDNIVKHLFDKFEKDAEEILNKKKILLEKKEDMGISMHQILNQIEEECEINY